MYKSNCGFDDTENKKQIVKHMKNNCDKDLLDANIVLFDLETTGLGNNAEILQLAAKCKEYFFNVYVQPVKGIALSASMITGFRLISGSLYHYDKIIENTLTIVEALVLFQQFLNNLPKKYCLLVAHNVSFDSRHLLQSIVNNNMIQYFTNIIGFSDSLTAFKKYWPERKGKDKFKLETLAKEFLVLEDGHNFHDAMYDVIILNELVEKFQILNILLQLYKTFEECYDGIVLNQKVNKNLQYVNELRDIISYTMLKRLAGHGIHYSCILETFEKEGDKGIIHLFSEKVGNTVRITKDKKVIAKVLSFLKKQKSSD